MTYTERITATLKCTADMMKILIDRFGEDVRTEGIDEDTFIATVDVSLSPNFYGWLFGFGGKIELLSPPAATEKYKELVSNVYNSLI